MAMGGATVDPAISVLFGEMKTKHTIRGFTMIASGGSEITIDKKIDNTCADPFQFLVDQFSNSNARLAVFDARGKTALRDTNKLVFMAWSGPSCGVKDKMAIAAAKDSTRNCFSGLSCECEAFNDASRPWVLDKIQKDPFCEFYGKAVKRDASGKYQYV